MLKFKPVLSDEDNIRDLLISSGYPVRLIPYIAVTSHRAMTEAEKNNNPEQNTALVLNFKSPLSDSLDFNSRTHFYNRLNIYEPKPQINIAGVGLTTGDVLYLPVYDASTQTNTFPTAIDYLKKEMGLLWGEGNANTRFSIERQSGNVKLGLSTLHASVKDNRTLIVKEQQDISVWVGYNMADQGEQQWIVVNPLIPESKHLGGITLFDGTVVKLISVELGINVLDDGHLRTIATADSMFLSDEYKANVTQAIKDGVIHFDKHEYRPIDNNKDYKALREFDFSISVDPVVQYNLGMLGSRKVTAVEQTMRDAFIQSLNGKDKPTITTQTDNKTYEMSTDYGVNSFELTSIPHETWSDSHLLNIVNKLTMKNNPIVGNPFFTALSPVVKEFNGETATVTIVYTLDKRSSDFDNYIQGEKEIRIDFVFKKAAEIPDQIPEILPGFGETKPPVENKVIDLEGFVEL